MSQQTLGVKREDYGFVSFHTHDTYAFNCWAFILCNRTVQYLLKRSGFQAKEWGRTQGLHQNITIH
jgi:hypothetical protein